MDRIGARRRAWGYLSLVTAAVVVVDQAAKQIARSNVEAGEPVDLLLGIKLVDVRNSGVAFGLDSGSDLLVVALPAVIVVLLLLLFARDPARPGLWPAVGLMVGGALSNLADRVGQGGVTDFLDLPLWPAFNVADVAIVAGAGLLIFGLSTPRNTDARPD